MKPPKVLPIALALLLVASLSGTASMWSATSFAYAEASLDAPRAGAPGASTDSETPSVDGDGGNAAPDSNGAPSEDGESATEDLSGGAQDGIAPEDALHDSPDELSADAAEEPETRAGSEISDAAGLVAAIAAATEGDTVVLASDFAASDVDIPMPDAAVTIDGNGVVWNAGTMKIMPGGAGSLTVKNLKFNGAALANTASSGTLRIEDAEFTGATAKSPLSITTSGDALTVVSRTNIHGNTGSNTASALWIGGASKVEMSYCTVENNTGTGGGYETGAISSKSFSGVLTINNTVFRNNVSTSANTGVIGGGGGAMAMH